MPIIAADESYLIFQASKATMLSKTIEFILKLQEEEEIMQREMAILSNEIAALDMSIV